MTAPVQVLKPLTLVMLLSWSLGAAGPARAGKLLDTFVDSLGEVVQAEIDGVRQELEARARVRTIDRAFRPSVVVRTSDGLLFQLRNASFISDPWLDPILVNAKRVEFRGGNRGRYRVVIEYRNSAQPDPLARMLVDSATKTLSKEVAEEDVVIEGIGGQARDGSDWLLRPADHRLRSIEFLNE